MGAPDILGSLFDKKILALLRVFYSNPDKQWYLREVSKKSKVSVATTSRLITKFLELGIIEQINISKFKLYKLGDNEHSRFLGQFIKREKQILQVFISRVKLLPGLYSIILHGPEEKTKANILLIGSGLNNDEVKSLCGHIQAEYNFRISPLVLTPEQFEQMSGMGMLTEKKQVLYSK